MAPSASPGLQPSQSSNLVARCEIGVDKAEGLDSRRLPLHVKSGETRNVRSVQSWWPALATLARLERKAEATTALAALPKEALLGMPYLCPFRDPADWEH